jgi:hypothetical protein
VADKEPIDAVSTFYLVLISCEKKYFLLGPFCTRINLPAQLETVKKSVLEFIASNKGLICTSTFPALLFGKVN